MIELMDRILDKLEKGARYGEVRYMSGESTGSSMRNSEFQGEGTSSGEGIAIRAMNESISMGFISSFDFDRIQEIIDRVIRNSHRGGRNKLDVSGGIKDKWDAVGKHKVEDIQSSDRMEIMKNADEMMKTYGLSVRMNAIYHKKIRQIYQNTSGSLIESNLSRIGYFMVGGYKEGTSFEEIYRQFGTTGGMDNFRELEIQKKIEDAVKNLKEISKSPSAKPGRYDVIISPEIAGIVAHESCGHPTEWDRISGREGSLAGESFLTGKKYPFRIGSPVVNVIDDPTLKGSYGYYKYDDEGIRARKRYLYKDGMTNEFIHSRESAASYGVEPNGGGRVSDWDMEPLARMSTTYIEPGQHTFDELVEDIKNGIYIKSYTEWNIDDIRFNEKYVGSEAFLIENGRLKGRVRKPAIETNTVNFYSSIDAVSNELEFSAGTCGKGDPEQGVDTWMGGPSVRLRNIYIS